MYLHHFKIVPPLKKSANQRNTTDQNSFLHKLIALKSRINSYSVFKSSQRGKEDVEVVKYTMKFTIFAVIFLIAELATNCWSAESDVIHLSDSDFESFMKENPVALVAFTGKSLAYQLIFSNLLIFFFF